MQIDASVTGRPNRVVTFHRVHAAGLAPVYVLTIVDCVTETSKRVEMTQEDVVHLAEVMLEASKVMS